MIFVTRKTLHTNYKFILSLTITQQNKPHLWLHGSQHDTLERIVISIFYYIYVYLDFLFNYGTYLASNIRNIIITKCIVKHV